MSDRVSITDGNGATNSVNDIEYYTYIRDTCVQIYNILVAHCGPLATDALIITNNPNNMKDRHYAIFTKDGINIVKSIEFTSPIQQHIQSLIVYIGERVDSLSHDGTTTSMMLFTKLVQLYFDEIIKDAQAETVTDRRAMRSDLQTCLKELLGYLNEDVITIDRFAEDFNVSKMEALSFIARHQAMLSSKGDTELSDAIVEVVQSLPVELYGVYTVSQSKVEADQRFNVLRDDFNFSLPVQFNLSDMNVNMGTEYYNEHCDIIVSEDDLKPGNMALEIVVQFIKEFRAEAFPLQLELEDIDLDTGRITVRDDNKELPAIPAGTPLQLAVSGNPLKDGLWIYNGPDQPVTRPSKKNDLVLITKSLHSVLHEEIEKINRKSVNKIVVFTMTTPNPYSSKCTVLSALLNVAGVYHLSEHLEDPSKKYLIKDAKVHLKHRRLYVSNLYKKDGSQYHPYYNDPTLFEPYTQMVQEIKTAIGEYSSGRVRIETAMDHARYQDYVEIFRRMICAEVKQLQICGMTHDVLADADVLKDSFGAVLASLENGFVLDGYLKLNSYIQRHKFEGKYHWLMAQALKDVLSSPHRISEPDKLQNVIELAVKHEDPYHFFPVGGNFTVLNKSTIRLNGESSEVVDHHHRPVMLVMQPVDTYRELFRRLTDLLPKIINTVRAIIPGTVNEGISK